jgi:hypothetical protein
MKSEHIFKHMYGIIYSIVHFSTHAVCRCCARSTKRKGHLDLTFETFPHSEDCVGERDYIKETKRRFP